MLEVVEGYLGLGTGGGSRGEVALDRGGAGFADDGGEVGANVAVRAGGEGLDVF